MSPQRALRTLFEKHGFRCREFGDTVAVLGSDGTLLANFVIHNSAQDLTESDIQWLMHRNGVIGAIRQKRLAKGITVLVRMNGHPVLEPQPRARKGKKK